MYDGEREQNIGSKYVNIDHPILHPIFHVAVDERRRRRGEEEGGEGGKSNL